MTDSNLIILICIFVLVVLTGCIVYTLILRKKYIKFTDDVCSDLDALIAGRKIEEKDLDYDKETLISKINLKTRQLSDVIENHERVNNEQKQQIQSIVSDISHQLKTPIANILMYNDTILNNELPREKELECLMIIHSQVEKMDFLINSLMKMSRLENNIITLNRIDIRLSESINEAVESVSVKARNKNITLDVKSDDAVIVNCDPKWFTEALFNIIDNGVKYTPDSGKIEVKTELLEMHIKIIIKDNGTGISQENINNVYKRFFREEKVHKAEGIGLGLFIAREIITQHGGYIKLDSKEGVGSTFTVYLPN